MVLNGMSERLKYARKSKGYTQASLAAAIGVSRGVIFNLEKNKAPAQRIVIQAICRTLHIRKDWLLDGTGEMNEPTNARQSAQILTELYDVAKGFSEPELLYLLGVLETMKQRLGLGADAR